jgi:dienelactone hydrolase
VLIGVSMGAGVVGALLPGRPHAAGAILLHAVADFPETIRAGFPVQAHVADLDGFAPGHVVAAWLDTAARIGADARVFTYPDAGHFYTDVRLPDHDAPAAALTWRRILDFLRPLPA